MLCAVVFSDCSDTVETHIAHYRANGLMYCSVLGGFKPAGLHIPWVARATTPHAGGEGYVKGYLAGDLYGD